MKKKKKNGNGDDHDCVVLKNKLSANHGFDLNANELHCELSYG